MFTPAAVGSNRSEASAAGRSGLCVSAGSRSFVWYNYWNMSGLTNTRNMNSRLHLCSSFLNEARTKAKRDFKHQISSNKTNQ